MKRLPATVTLAAVVFAQLLDASGQSAPHTNSNASLEFGNAAGNLQSLPPAPQGKSTILGGEILNIDPVRDQFSLRAFGERPMKILFDERTQVYRDGKRIPLRTLGNESHVSVQTILDGTSVFALSIHILSQAPQGECEGQVLSFNPVTGELAVQSALSPEPIKLIVPANTLVARMGQSTFTSGNTGLADLIHGALVSIKFNPDRQDRPIATEVSILATPGSEFILAGEISFLDLNSGQLDLVDSRDQKRYQISFSSTRIPTARSLHMGDHIRVAANFDAARYVASDITVY